MGLNAFNKTELDYYKTDAKARWGGTKAYQQYEKKAAGRSDFEDKEIADRFMALFAELGGLQHLSPSAKEVQEKIAGLQEFITENYYTCTDEILSGLGQMYVADERFKRNIDKTGGEGTAAFVSQAISEYCAR